MFYCVPRITKFIAEFAGGGRSYLDDIKNNKIVVNLCVLCGEKI